MKRLKLIALVLTLVVSACGGGGDVQNGPTLTNVAANGQTNFDASTLATQLATYPTEDLNASELASLPFMREEEKLAQNVYAQLDGIWSAQTSTFGNITQSEATHTEAVRQLLVKYNLTDPAATLASGVFYDQQLQTLYTQLVSDGSTTLIDALKVGVAIEELDIRDIQNALTGIDNQDITAVYENLMKGSRNHLRAFYTALTNAGGTYVPQYISLDAFQAIVNSEIER